MSRRIPEGSSNANQTVMKTIIKRKKQKRASYKKTLAQVPTKNQVRQMINRSFNLEIEHKSFYVSIPYTAASPTWPSNVGTVVDISAITQGVGFTSRIGQEVIPTSVEVRWNISSPNTTTQSTGYFIRMVVALLTINSTTVTPSSIIVDASNLYALVSPYANTTRSVRKILWEYTVNLYHRPGLGNAGALSTAASTNSNVGSTYIPLSKLKSKWKPMTFDSNAITGENHIFLLTVSNMSAQATMWNHYIYTTLNFIDA